MAFEDGSEAAKIYERTKNSDDVPEFGQDIGNIAEALANRELTLEEATVLMVGVGNVAEFKANEERASLYRVLSDSPVPMTGEERLSHQQIQDLRSIAREARGYALSLAIAANKDSVQSGNAFEKL